jgi:ABC-type multidrug transport system ATPase subunit
MAPPFAPPVLRVEGLGFGYPGQPPLFSTASFELPAGVTLLQGDMSSGKTTLLRLLAGELSGSGRRLLLGRPVEDDPQAWRRAVCWFDPRDPALDPLTPGDLLATLARQHGEVDHRRWQQHVDAFDLAPHVGKPMYALSTGSRRKAALAAALSCTCPLTLLDEPAGGLDGPSLAHLRRALAQADRAPQRALLLVCSHGLDGLPVSQVLSLPLA